MHRHRVNILKLRFRRRANIRKLRDSIGRCKASTSRLKGRPSRILPHLTMRIRMLSSQSLSVRREELLFIP